MDKSDQPWLADPHELGTAGVGEAQPLALGLRLLARHGFEVDHYVYLVPVVEEQEEKVPQ